MSNTRRIRKGELLTPEKAAKLIPMLPAGPGARACIACLQTTDTGLATRGELSWHSVFLTFLGITEAEAERIAARFLMEGAEAGKLECYPVPGAEDDSSRLMFDVRWAVCSDCIAEAEPNFPRPVLAIPGAVLPVIGQPDDLDGE